MSESSIPRRYATLQGEYSRLSSIDLLCNAIRVSDRHELVITAGGDETANPLDWRLFTEDDRIEAIIVCTQDEAALEAARQLAMRGKPLLIEASASLPADFVTEMSLYDSEGTSVLKPWFFPRPHFRILCRWLNEAGLGTLQSIEYERLITPNTSDDDQELANLTLWDVDLLRWLGGDYSQVTCIRTGGDDGPFITQTVQLAGPGLPDATLTYRRVTSAASAIFRFVGTDNSAELLDSRNMFTWKVGGEQIHHVPIMPDKKGLDELYRNELDELWTGAKGSACWRDLVRNFEIREAMQRSLRRRRTIDLHFETTSERSQFKTHMAATGCGVILWTMFGIIGLLFAGAVLDPRDNMQRTAEAADFVLRNGEFTPGTAIPTEEGVMHVRQIAEQMNLNESVVFIEATDAPATDAARLASVRSALAEKGADEEGRVVVRPLRGQWFAFVMQLARVLVFAPVGVFLLFQVLLLIAKPAAASGSTSR